VWTPTAQVGGAAEVATRLQHAPTAAIDFRRKRTVWRGALRLTVQVARIVRQHERGTGPIEYTSVEPFPPFIPPKDSEVVAVRGVRTDLAAVAAAPAADVRQVPGTTCVARGADRSRTWSRWSRCGTSSIASASAPAAAAALGCKNYKEGPWRCPGPGGPTIGVGGFGTLHLKNLIPELFF